ncbi:AAA domain-containing protein, putative AbiEii toxin, Type IV TA system [Lachnospiraceae bacterium G41]|nr:AAA domain-containing protein, putative AbiEii toxin, Type IV TA system [Lachnospiraceae bacterium G41]
MNDIYLLNCTVSGIKNLSEEIRLDFYKKVVNKSFNPEKYKVKAIYGENGSGKTAIITAISIAKNIFMNTGYLSQTETQMFLSEIINKKTQRFSFKAEFLYKENEEQLRVFSYALEIKKNSFDKYVITLEELKEKNGNTNTNSYKCVFSIDNGDVAFINVNDDIRERINTRVMNLLSYDTFVTVLLERTNSKEVDLLKDILSQLIITCFFFISINIYLDQEDTHELYLFRQIKEKLDLNNKAGLMKLLDLREQQDKYYISKNIDRVLKKHFKEYEKKIERLYSFLKVFKTDLKQIKIEKKEDREYYNCELVLVYDGYSVNREFESTGIKKLIRLFECLSAAGDGDIVFIDEMDSNINAVYLCKIIEYFMYYGKGQLCFTTHNTEPMDILKDNKNSIEFLSTDNHLVSWKIKGNASPDNYYRNGYIEDIPFNIDSTDFIGIF